jgi:hypothetical protein
LRANLVVCAAPARGRRFAQPNKEHAMRQLMSIKKFAMLLAIVAATCLGTATGYAGNSRTWVSGTGSDTGSCTRTAPCLTFAYAIMQTNSYGEIDCLDPAGFGIVTISISVTIDCEAASNGGIEASGGNDAITINTAGIVVNLIGLDLNGQNSSGSGVSITAGAIVNIRNCKIYGFSGGLGIAFFPASVGGQLVVDNVFISDTTNAINEGPVGVANMTIRNSNINNNSYGIIVGGGTHAGATIEQTTLSFNGTGVYAQGSGAVAVIGSSTVVNNNVGVSQSSGGIVYSAKNNQIYGNGTDGTPLTAYPGFSGGGA